MPSNLQQRIEKPMKFYLYFTLPNNRKAWLTAKNGISPTPDFINAVSFPLRESELENLKKQCLRSLRSVFEVGSAEFLRSETWKGVKFEDVRIEHEEAHEEVVEVLEFPGGHTVTHAAS